MSAHKEVTQLHDKATRGLQLSTEEHAQLDAWYTEQDQQERTALATADASQRLAMLQTNISTVLAQILSATQRIQELSIQNQALRQEITALQHQLSIATPSEPV